MSKILIITTFYYPIQHIATNRIVAFAKYLTEFGYDITVLTKGNEEKFDIIDGINVHYVSDKSIFQKCNTNKKENKLFHYLKCAWNIVFMNIFMDEDRGWTKRALKVVENLLEKERFDYILSSAPPIGPHIIAYKLKKKYKNIKWIADMRDAMWSPNYPENLRKKLIAFIKEIGNACDVLLAVSKFQLNEYCKITENRTCYLEIRNGYDFEKNINLNNVLNNNFTILYTGNFYGSRKPDNFFRALEKLIYEYKYDDISVEIIGNGAPITIPDKIKSIVILKDRMNYDSLINYILEKADLLLMISPKDIEKGVYTGKLFDYIGTGKSILGLVPEDDVAAKLIKKTGTGYVAENENIDAIVEQLQLAYLDWKNKVAKKPSLQVIKEHHRREQVRRLFEFLKNKFRKGV